LQITGIAKEDGTQIDPLKPPDVAFGSRQPVVFDLALSDTRRNVWGFILR
jgi:hypothetical protein